MAVQLPPGSFPRLLWINPTLVQVKSDHPQPEQETGKTKTRTSPQVPQTWWHDVIVLNVLTNIWFPFNCEFATIVFVCYLKQNIKTIKNSNLTTVFWFWLGRESFFSLPINFFGETQVLDWISLHNFPNIQIQYFYKSTSRNCRTSKDQGYWVAMCVGEVGKSSIAISFFRI